MHDLDDTIRSRRAVRGYRPVPVPDDVIRACLELAQRAPSNCNVQPWRVFLASGAARDRLRDRLTAAVKAGEPERPEHPIDSFPGEYRPLQIACAVSMYGAMGIERGDKAGRFRAHLRNFELFDAPHLAIVCMAKHFGIGVALDVGMYVQTLMLALWSRGVASCPMASMRLYPDIVHRELGIPDDLEILCGLAFGYEDPSVPVNASRQDRLPIERCVTMVVE